MIRVCIYRPDGRESGSIVIDDPKSMKVLYDGCYRTEHAHKGKNGDVPIYQCERGFVVGLKNVCELYVYPRDRVTMENV